jgi:prepilin-type N-terminal cleavage/methylation domain-containing protein
MNCPLPIAHCPLLRSRAFRFRGAGFTLIELLVVMLIIGVLVAITIPVVGKMRIRAKEADTKNFIAQLSAAIQNYYNDHRAYPGPLSNDEVGAIAFSIPVDLPAGLSFVDSPDPEGPSMSENLVLGLLGGLRFDAGTIFYDPSIVGQGPNSLGGSPKRNNPYVEATNLSWRDEDGDKTGRFQDEVDAADDTIIPEFVDRFTSPMPILYLRARVGATSTGADPDDNPVITDGTGSRTGHYDLSQYRAYVCLEYRRRKVAAGG